MTTFRLLHASDLHFAERPNVVGVADLAEACVGDALGLTSSHSPDLADELERLVKARGDLDGVLLTGDLATTGSAGDLRAAHAYLRRLRRAAPVFALPGNHDRYGPRLRPGNRAFDALFGWPAGQQQATLVALLAKAGRKLAIAGADLSLPRDHDGEGPLGWLGQGIATDAAIQSLGDVTAQVRRDHGEATAVVWALHFAPGFRGISRLLKLIDADKVTRAARRCGVELVLSGHTHEHREYRRHQVTVMCAGTATQHRSRDGNAVHLVDIRVGREGTRCRRVDLVFDDDTGTFEEIRGGSGR